MHRRDQVGADQAETGRYLTFTLGAEEYALPLLRVKEVIGYSEPTPIPQAPAHFRGVINLRGQVISIIDLRSKLSLETVAPRAETSIVILDLQGCLLGVVVDSVDCVLALAENEIDTQNDVGNFVNGRHVLGIAKKDDRLIILLDIRATLEVEDLETLKRQIPVAS